MKDSITTAGQEVSQKAKNATENVRLGNLIKNNDKMVEKLLYQVGLKYYEAHGQEQETEYQELFDEINRLKAENAGYQQELDNLAATNKCPQCGFVNNAGAKFCINCGAPLNQAPVAPMQTSMGKCCDKCGAMNEADSLFCTECGNRLNVEPVQQEVRKPMVYGVPGREKVEPVQPVTEPVQSVAEPVQSVAEPVQPVAEPVQPTVESAEAGITEDLSGKEAAAGETESAVVEVDAEKPARCAKCGALLEEDALFCTSCGARIE